MTIGMVKAILAQYSQIQGEAVLLHACSLKKRMNIFLYASRMSENGNKESLIIELEAPRLN